ncbi:hypothetical protein INT44_000897 [Umbelopsis vinacea]|uniref:Mitochondrial zinc maintenance protein 1, mitochondrial n=1 Tax=Umbelopsis vinacea TaxID=44442 RepID=A0A8H7QB56_9FUNG|nr:hypothetical protein INT44_000897 [Umbelopsis vinacea]KAI9289503.1 hypothetical protein BC943DRAFT_314492 [Umbelopsis sp. AD052]
MSTQRAVALGAYRNLLKAQKQTFGADLVALNAARAKTYVEFNNSKNETDPAVVDEKIKLANQVASILKSNIVQGVRKEEETDTDIYKLKFHPGIELGDNDSIRNSKGSLRKSKKQKASGGCCGGH